MTSPRCKLMNVLVAVSGLGLAVLYNFSPSEHSFYPRCPFYAATHLLCPGCGGTRALYALLHFQFRQALSYNSLLTFLLPLAFLWFTFCYYSVLRHDRFPRLVLSRTAWLGLAGLLVAFAIVRNTGVAL